MEATAVPRRVRVQLPLRGAVLARLGDDALVEQVRRGNERAFEVVYDRYHAGLLAFCRHMLGSADEAEDALQQVFVSAHADLLRDDRPIALKAWLYTIARNRCLSILRARREQASELVDTPTEGLSEEVERRLELRALLGDLRELPEQQRAALVLAEVGDLSHQEIGQIIGCERNKVKALIFQARSALIDARRARETPCADIREQLATLRGGALRRSEIRRHLKACPGCAEFREEVRRQRAMLALLLPVAPSVGLKRSILAAAGIGPGGSGGAGIATGVAAKSGLAKLAVAGAIGSAAVGGGVVLEQHGSPPSQGDHAASLHAVAASRTSGPLVPAAIVRHTATVKQREQQGPAAPQHRRRHHPAQSHRLGHGRGNAVDDTPAHAPSLPPAAGHRTTGGRETGLNRSSFGRSHKPAPPPHARQPQPATPPASHRPPEVTPGAGPQTVPAPPARAPLDVPASPVR